MAVAGANALPGFFAGGLEVEHYDAVFYENGTLIERYTYDVSAPGEYRMLFRYWDAPLSFHAIDRPHIEFSGMTSPAGTIGYVRDYRGEVRTVAGTAGSDEVGTIQNLALDNEVGIFNPDYFAPGTYTVEYRYVLRPPVEYDREWAHLNLKLLDEHVPFRDIRVTLPFAGMIEEVYTHPPTLAVERTGEAVVITGNAPENDALNIEMILDPAFMEGSAVSRHMSVTSGNRRPTPTDGRRYCMVRRVSSTFLETFSCSLCRSSSLVSTSATAGRSPSLSLNTSVSRRTPR